MEMPERTPIGGPKCSAARLGLVAVSQYTRLARADDSDAQQRGDLTNEHGLHPLCNLPRRDPSMCGNAGGVHPPVGGPRPPGKVASSAKDLAWPALRADGGRVGGKQP